jgi:TRAP-type mannitol/chloroaromatic compound transport system permease small subunit
LSASGRHGPVSAPRPVEESEPAPAGQVSEETALGAALGFTRAIDWVNARFGTLANWCILISCLISAGNAMVRYGIGTSSNAWLEIQWYLFSAAFLLGASYTLKVNEHVRVDIAYAVIGERGRLWVDLIGIIFFLFPATTILAWMTWPFFLDAYMRGEMSGNAGGLIRWPVKILMPLGFVMLTLQGVSEMIKRIAALMGLYQVETKYEKPLQ